MRIIGTVGTDDIARVFIAETGSGQRIEFVESVQPPIPREIKWVNIVSTLFGCPVGCAMCDAGLRYKGKLTAEQILFQIKYLTDRRFQDRVIPVKKWKIQFARMGEPSFNSNVLKVLCRLPSLYDAPGLLPSLSTVAPRGCERFFEELVHVKNEYYAKSFQFQFSIHSTDPAYRRKLIPVDSWSFEEMAKFGEIIHRSGGRKITLNFAIAKDVPLKPGILLKYFDPNVFLIKVTPLNTTVKSVNNNLYSTFNENDLWERAIEAFRQTGYEVIVSIGELEENAIGSNCGQYITAFENGDLKLEDVYTYSFETIANPG